MSILKYLLLFIIIFWMGISVHFKKASGEDTKQIKKSKVADDKSSEIENDVNDEDLPDLETLEEDVWPPNGISLNDDPVKWPGHLESFGSVGKIHNVDIYKRFPKPTVFFSEYVAPYIPLVMRGCMNGSTALKKWASDSYFLNLPQAHTQWFSAEESQNITFMKFIRDYKNKKLVYDKEVPAFLSEDVPIPSSLLCDPVIKSFSTNSLNVYGFDFSSPVTRRNLDTIRCVFAGKQDLVLVNNIEFGDVMPHNFHEVDVKKVDYKKFPSMRQVEYHKITVNSGDCIFIPTKWFWQQNSVTGTKAVDLTWQHKIKNVKPSECANYTSPPTLNMATFPDQTALTDPKMLIAVQHFSSYLISSPNLTYQHFEAELKKDKKLMSAMVNWTDEYAEITAELFEILDLNSDKTFSVADLELMTPEKLTHIHLDLDDLLTAYQDILTDEQEEAKETSIKDKAGTMDAEAAVTNQLADYMKVIENVIMESIEEFSVTGKLPDMEKKMQQKVKNLGGKAPEEKDTTPKTAREKAKEQLKPKKKEEDLEESSEFTEAEENYQVIDVSVVEEIIMDEDVQEAKTTGIKEVKKVDEKEEIKKKKEKKEKPGKHEKRQKDKKKKSKHEEL